MGHTSGYIANRDRKFNGKTTVVIESGLTLKKAQKKLLDMFNNDYDTSYPNWGMAVIRTKNNVEGATRTFKDGTRSYEYDSRRFYIEKI